MAAPSEIVGGLGALSLMGIGQVMSTSRRINTNTSAEFLAVTLSNGATEALSVAQTLSLPAEAYGNDPNVEMIWAMKAYQHAEVYYNLISAVDPRNLKLTKTDDLLYSVFREEFPTLCIDKLDPEDLKSPPAKEKWQPFCMKFEKEVEDFNYGTLLRLDSNKDYTEENTIFSTRIQFFAIEIARNREGCNDVIFQRKKSGSVE